MKEEYYDDCAFQYYVVTSFGLPIKRVYVMYLNDNYVRYGELDLKQLFCLEDCTDRVVSMQNDTRNTINLLKKTHFLKKSLLLKFDHIVIASFMIIAGVIFLSPMFLI
jgi:hypothetical protein